MKHLITILLFAFPVLLYAQYPNNPNKIRLGFQTTGNGLIYRAGSAPTQFPTGYNSPFQQYDTVTNILWVYQDSFWYATNTVRRSTPPPYSSTSSGLTLVYGHATWQDSDDEQRYEYVANDNIEAWVPAVGIHYATSAPADIAATGTTGAVEYTAALWNKTPTDSLFRHDGSNWVFIGRSGPHFVRGDSGSLQDISEGDTLTITGGYGINIVTATGDTVTVIVDTTQIATLSDVANAGFVVDADSGTPQTISSGDTLQINSGWGVNTSVGATGVVTVAGDSTQVATLYDVSVVQGDINAHEAADGDLSATNEIQQIDTFSFSSPTLSISLSSDGVAAKTANLSGLLSGYVTGSGTAGRVPRWTSSSAIGDGVLRDDGTLLALGGVTVSGYSFYDYSTGAWRLATGTTAQRPTNIAGLHRYNTSLGYSETGDGSNWLQSDFPVGTTGQTLRHNGTSWIANSFLFNTGSAVGINDATPSAQLDITGWLRLSGDGNDGASIGIGQRNSNLNGSNNISIGDQNNTNTSATGNLNIRIGARAGNSVTTGDSNIAIGNESIRNLSTGSDNVAIGTDAGRQFLAGRGLLTGSNNLMFGAKAGYDLIQTAASQGIFLGNESGSYASVASSCIFLGYRAGKDNNVANVIAIGNNSLPTAANQILIGDANGSYTQLKSRNYAFNIDQTVGAGQDGYALKYNHSSGEIELAVDAGSTAPTTLYTGDGTVADSRTVTIAQDSTLTFQMANASPNNLDLYSQWGYAPDWGANGFLDYSLSDSFEMYTVLADQSNDAYYYTEINTRANGDGFYIYADANGQFTIDAENGTKTGSFNIQNTGFGYGAFVYGFDGVEFDTGSGGEIYFQINNTTEAIIDATGLGINDTSPEKSLDVGGMGKFRQLSGQDNSVTIGTNANAGTGRSASITDAQSSDVAGRFSFTTGTTLTAGEWVTLTWATAFDNPPAVQLFPEDPDGASLAGLIYVVPTTTGCSIAVNTNSATYESKTYEFNYIVIQGK